MTLLLEEPTAKDDQNAQLLFKEARRRRRRLRVIWMAMGATVIVVSVGLGLTLHRSSSPPCISWGHRATGLGLAAAPPHRSDACLCPQRPSNYRRGLRCHSGASHASSVRGEP